MGGWVGGMQSRRAVADRAFCRLQTSICRPLSHTVHQSATPAQGRIATRVPEPKRMRVLFRPIHHMLPYPSRAGWLAGWLVGWLEEAGQSRILRMLALALGTDTVVMSLSSCWPRRVNAAGAASSARYMGEQVCCYLRGRLLFINHRSTGPLCPTHRLSNPSTKPET